MHLHSRLAGPVKIVPGITGMSGAWTASGAPIGWGDGVLTVLMATLPDEELVRRIHESHALVVMTIGRNLPKLRRDVDAACKKDRDRKGDVEGKRGEERITQGRRRSIEK